MPSSKLKPQKIRICPKCDKEIIIGVDRYFFWGNDHPYFNLCLHIQCYQEIKGNNGGLLGYLLENKDNLLQKYHKNAII